MAEKWQDWDSKFHRIWQSSSSQVGKVIQNQVALRAFHCYHAYFKKVYIFTPACTENDIAAVKSFKFIAPLAIFQVGL